MKIKDIIKNWEGEWFKISPKRTDDYLYIYSPEMEKSGHTSKELDEWFEEFIRLEGYIKLVGKKGWIACTDLKNDHIMIYMATANARPFELNIDENALYFVKILGDE